jgi:hypothetical protein
MNRLLLALLCVACALAALALPFGQADGLLDSAASTKAGGTATGRTKPVVGPAKTTTSPSASSSPTSSSPSTTAGPSTTSSTSAAPTATSPATATEGSLNSAPPSAAGYFSTAPVGAWSALPTGADCAQAITRSTWEPRPENTPQNHAMPNAQAVHDSFASRPRGNGYDPRWDQWLLPRVDGQFAGTTDEIIQWAACKWGISDNLLRAQAVRESTWYQGLHFADGQCYWNRGCGDAFSAATSNSTTYCNDVARFGHDYQSDANSTRGAYPFTPGVGLCPKTFSIIGIMAWDAPEWQAPGSPYSGNQNGTFPFSRDSTAFAMDYEASYLRGCYEGWITWLGPANDMSGCVGAWYSGDWHSTDADAYVSRVQGELTNRTWLTADFAKGAGGQYACDPVKGCPR